MAQTIQPPDPEFVAALKGDIRGVYFSDVSHYDADKISAEFLSCRRDRSLIEDEQFMDNLIFTGVIHAKSRKWTVRECRLYGNIGRR